MFIFYVSCTFLLPVFVSGSSCSNNWRYYHNDSLCNANKPILFHLLAVLDECTANTSCVPFDTKHHRPCSINGDMEILNINYVNDLLNKRRVHNLCLCNGTQSSCPGQFYARSQASLFCIKGEEISSLCNKSSFACGSSLEGCVQLKACKNYTTNCHDERGCCCRSSFCNYVAKENATRRPKSLIDNNISGAVILIIVLASVIVFVLLCLAMWLFHRCKTSNNIRSSLQPREREYNDIPLIAEKSCSDELNAKELPPPLEFSSIKNMKVLSHGQRGTRSVYTADCDGRILAAKYFALNDYSSWDAELKIYALPHMTHENLLSFVGYTTTDYAIFTEYLPMGSLQDVLKQRQVSWDDLLHIGTGMMCGLAYLHAAIPSQSPRNAKPPIAHRDFKSRNVLLKEDLTACVADFGLALPFDSARRTSNCGQVGTLRYMAPEVLDLAVNFSCEAFLRIDVYACGLTLWEILRRCSKPSELIANSVYEQPFEAQLKEHYPKCQNHPTLSEMQDIVFVRRLRPTLPPLNSVSQALYDLLVTIEQCWDHDSEARPSAGCVYNRIKRIREQISKVSTGQLTMHDDHVAFSNSHLQPCQKPVQPLLDLSSNMNSITNGSVDEMNNNSNLITA